jgi:hypothetical protein
MREWPKAYLQACQYFETVPFLLFLQEISKAQENPNISNQIIDLLVQARYTKQSPSREKSYCGEQSLLPPHSAFQLHPLHLLKQPCPISQKTRDSRTKVLQAMLSQSKTVASGIWTYTQNTTQRSLS